MVYVITFFPDYHTARNHVDVKNVVNAYIQADNINDALDSFLEMASAQDCQICDSIRNFLIYIIETSYENELRDMYDEYHETNFETDDWIAIFGIFINHHKKEMKFLLNTRESRELFKIEEMVILNTQSVYDDILFA